MKQGMTLQDLLKQVQRHAASKRDFTAFTKDSVRMVEMEGFPNRVALVLLKDGAGVLERFGVSDTAHMQIADALGIPYRYYQRLLADHLDLVLTQVNALFEREPARRLIRVLDERVRAYLSDRYLRIDNEEILVSALPAIVKGEQATRLLSCNVSPERMDIKCLYTDPSLQFNVGYLKDGRPDTVQPGFHFGNNEVGKGSLFVRAFFWRTYCDNGAVYGLEEALDFRRSHLGGRLIEGTNFEVLSDATKKLDDAAIMSAMKDVVNALARPEVVEAMAEKLRTLKAGGDLSSPVSTMPTICKELALTEKESASALENLIKDQDYSRWGVLNAVTALANDAETYERATELEMLSAKIVALPQGRWDQLRQPVKVAA